MKSLATYIFAGLSTPVAEHDCAGYRELVSNAINAVMDAPCLPGESPLERSRRAAVQGFKIVSATARAAIQFTATATESVADREQRLGQMLVDILEDLEENRIACIPELIAGAPADDFLALNPFLPPRAVVPLSGAIVIDELGPMTLPVFDLTGEWSTKPAPAAAPKGSWPMIFYTLPDDEAGSPVSVTSGNSSTKGKKPWWAEHSGAYGTGKRGKGRRKFNKGGAA